MTIQEAKGVLADAEKSIRDLMQRELGVRRYSELGELALIADALARLAREVPQSTPATESSASGPPPTSHKPAASRVRPKASIKRSPAKRDYPRFERENDRLIKVGWSKKSREEYEHRAPRSAVLAFAEYLGTATAKGKTFVMEDLFPVYDAMGEELPGYQVYLALAWLRQFGAVEKKGREGYVRITDPLDGSLFDNLWDRVPERS
ncbi:MAG: hypothetical protein ABI539_10665 [Acidobacteriota bacterium]